jgi:hypothetical protein
MNKKLTYNLLVECTTVTEPRNVESIICKLVNTVGTAALGKRESNIVINITECN